jgi:hypothetical protein
MSLPFYAVASTMTFFKKLYYEIAILKTFKHSMQKISAIINQKGGVGKTTNISIIYLPN